MHSFTLRRVFAAGCGGDVERHPDCGEPGRCATRSAGHRRRVRRTGASADVDALTHALGELLDSPEKRRSLGKAGRTRAVNVFSWEAVAAQTVRVYQRAIARKAVAEGEGQC